MPRGGRTRRCEPIVALGAMTFGGRTSAADAGRMLDMFLEEGYTWVDTAYMYTNGRSERILGGLLKGRRRRKVFLATKAHPGKLGKGKPRGLTPGSIRGQLEAGLQRLKTDCVDLLYLHAPDNRTPLEVSLGTCRELIAEGKVREIGLSNYASWQVAEAVLLCLQHEWTPPLVYQGMYNVLTRDVERECIAACRHLGVDFLAYNPLAGGLLTGKHRDPAAMPREGRFSGKYYRNRFWKAEYFQALDALATLCRRTRIPLAEASLRWLTHHSMSDGVVLGASTVEHLQQNLAACRKGPLSPTFCKALDDAWALTRPVCERYFRE